MALSSVASDVSRLMRIEFSSSRLRMLTGVALIVMLNGLTTGCSADATRLSSPLFPGATENQHTTIGGGPPPTYGEYTGSVKKQPPRNAATKRKSLLDFLGLPKRDRKIETVPADTRVTSRPADYTRSSDTWTGSGGGWTAAGGTAITMREGDSIYSLSRRFGVPSKELMRVNHISDPSEVRAGQRIIIPTYVYGLGAPVSAPDAGHGGRIAKLEAGRYPRPAANPRRFRGDDGPLTTASISRRPTPTSAGNVHVVESGESLGGIAMRYGVRRSDIMRLNGIDNPDHIRIGQRLTIPGAGAPMPVYSSSGTSGTITTASIPPVVVSAPRPPRKPLHTASIRARPGTEIAARAEGEGRVPMPVSRPGRANPAAVRPPQRAEEVRTAAAPATVERARDGVSFRWPVRGRIVSSFGSSTDGERNDGINLAVPEGTSVKAAETGVVVYSGNELKGFGNLVLIKHKQGWVTAYAHNSELLVERGDRVNRGQIIGKAGKTGSVTSPQVHFELRKGSKPVDPNLYLTNS